MGPSWAKSAGEGILGSLSGFCNWNYVLWGQPCILRRNSNQCSTFPSPYYYNHKRQICSKWPVCVYAQGDVCRYIHRPARILARTDWHGQTWWHGCSVLLVSHPVGPIWTREKKPVIGCSLPASFSLFLTLEAYPQGPYGMWPSAFSPKWRLRGRAFTSLLSDPLVRGQRLYWEKTRE